jgi:RimJ/RimL family protein N-acetyltransferase
VTDRQIRTSRLDLLPLPASVAAVLPQQRAMAARLLGLKLPDQWPQADLYDVLPLQAAADFDDEPFGVWLIVERESGTVVGDIGFMGPPAEDGSVEIGYSVIPGRRRRGYATEAGRALVGWALSQPNIRAVSAACSGDNAASIRVLERLGFARTGEEDGQLRWQLDAGV